MINKEVIYKNIKYYVDCDINDEFWGSIGFNKSQRFGNPYEYYYEGNFCGYGDNYIDIISNLIRETLDEPKELKLIRDLEDWDGVIK